MGIALVTGTSSGIGLAAAVRLAHDGHRVFASMRDLSRSGDLEAAASAAGVDVELVALDVCNDDSVASAVEHVVSVAGTVDVLVNNAGVSGGGPVELTDLDTYRWNMEANYFGVIRCIQAVLPAMRERGSGAIVTVSSLAGRRASQLMSAYAGSKFAVEGLCEALAAEVAGFGIRVCLVEPGVILTPIFEKGSLGEPDTPYAHLTRRQVGYFMAGMRLGQGPELVADAISEAVDGSEYRLRWPVGADAEAVLAARSQHPVEEFIKMHGDDDEAYYARFEELTGLNTRPDA